VAKLTVNKKFFSSWNPEMAYVLGFISADGYLGVKRIRKDKSKQYFLDITSKDFSLLKKIKKMMGAKQKIGIKYSGSNKKEKCYRLQIGYQEICKDLLKLGIRPKKASTLNSINIPEEYFPDFVRGFFDGDGSVYIYKVNGTPQIKAQIVSASFSFIKELNRSICKKLNIPEKTVHKEPGGNSSIYAIYFYIDDCEKLYQFMYGNNPVLYLPRKRRVFERWKSIKRRHYIKQNYPSKIGWHLNQSYRLSSYSKIST
jgi:intein-encoded DNA endonuclease-like protein